MHATIRFQNRFRKIFTRPTDQTVQRIGVRLRTRRVHSVDKRQRQNEPARIVRREFRSTR